uniref:Cytochrome c554 and c-prime n=1 Tax=Candidatus Kentrum sp. SD TaxID=2126332 RepID=A0A450YVF4_9GAMM|nr:MAG: Cytochrome c554 and c-prime [Candidatus Kentron sp. SD]VFK49733.1 MAG: Cytochrome c554 and c-prime [Candidatus Kentron sp. SD]
MAEQGSVRISPDLSDQPPLAPETCGFCHPSQYTDWMESRHARAMGPGAIGQFFSMSEEESRACLNCHAPLHEQFDALTRYLDDLQWVESADLSATTHARKSLHERGVICATCHIRAGRWHGPPRRRDPLSSETMEAFPHRGWVSSHAFQDSRFCAACHQFSSDGSRLNGKLLENTYEEWRASPQARQGISCQTCHMPDRRHLFRGIHDPETVRGGVDVGSKSFSFSNGEVSVLVFLTNTGVGHRLPTYVTPEIRLGARQLDKNGVPIPGTEQIEWVARKVSLDLATEYFDTRLSPGQTATLAYKRPLSAHAESLVTRVYVEPDALYTRIYEALLDEEPDGQDSLLIRKALEESQASGFTLYEKHYPIGKAVKNSDTR